MILSICIGFRLFSLIGIGLTPIGGFDLEGFGHVRTSIIILDVHLNECMTWMVQNKLSNSFDLLLVPQNQILRTGRFGPKWLASDQPSVKALCSSTISLPSMEGTGPVSEIPAVQDKGSIGGFLMNFW